MLIDFHVPICSMTRTNKQFAHRRSQYSFRPLLGRRPTSYWHPWRKKAVNGGTTFPNSWITHAKANWFFWSRLSPCLHHRRGFHRPFTQRTNFFQKKDFVQITVHIIDVLYLHQSISSGGCFLVFLVMPPVMMATILICSWQLHHIESSMNWCTVSKEQDVNIRAN